MRRNMLAGLCVFGYIVAPGPVFESTKASRSVDASNQLPSLSLIEKRMILSWLGAKTPPDTGSNDVDRRAVT